MTSPRRVIAPALLALGLVARVLGLPLFGTYDTEVQKAWSARAATHGLSDIYGPADGTLLGLARARGGSTLQALLTLPFPKTTFLWGTAEYFVDYPPGSVLVLWGVGKLWAAYDPELRGRRASNVAVNLAPALCSLGIALLLFRAAPRSLGWARALAFWLNPAVLLAAPVLGYQDTIFGLLALAAVLALAGGRPATASALFVASALVKPQAALLAPFVLIAVWREAKVLGCLRGALAGAATAALMLAPWWTQGHLLSALDGCRRPLGQVTLAPLGFNVWWIAGYAMEWARQGPWPLARIETIEGFRQWAGFDPRLVSRILLSGATLANAWLFVRTPGPDGVRLPLAAILQVHAYALLGTSVHENHTFLAVILAPLLLGAWPGARILYAGTSGFLFASLLLTAGLGRRITRLASLEAWRLATVLDMSVIVAVAHVVLVAWMFRAVARPPGSASIAGPVRAP